VCFEEVTYGDKQSYMPLLLQGSTFISLVALIANVDMASSILKQQLSDLIFRVDFRTQLDAV